MIQGYSPGPINNFETSPLVNLVKFWTESHIHWHFQSLTLGLFRSDYLMQAGEANNIKQVEFNTIASSFGAVTSNLPTMARYRRLSLNPGLWGMGWDFLSFGGDQRHSSFSCHFKEIIYKTTYVSAILFLSKICLEYELIYIKRYLIRFGDYLLHKCYKFFYPLTFEFF